MQFDFKRMFRYERNVGDQDRQIRYGVGALTILASMFLGSIPLLLLGIGLLASGYTRFCPVYAAMGRTTLPSCCTGKAEEEGHSRCPGEEKEESSCCSGKDEAHQH